MINVRSFLSTAQNPETRDFLCIIYARTYYEFYYSRCATRSFVGAQRIKEERTANVLRDPIWIYSLPTEGP